MKNYIIGGVFIVAVIVAMIWAALSNRTLSEGRKTPNLKVENNDSTINLRSLGGKYVLVDFWSSADAGSRIKSNEYNTLSVVDDGEVERISVNFDRSERLFEEIVSRDRMDPSQQFHVKGKAAGRIRRDFKLHDGYKSYLISPEGRILAVNPEPDYIERIVKKRG